MGLRKTFLWLMMTGFAVVGLKVCHLIYGAMIEPVAVAAHATMRGGDLKGKNVVVSGAGTIGNLVAQFAKARGAKRVLITDVSDSDLKSLVNVV